MDTYATVVTAVLFFMVGYIVAFSQEAWYDGRSIAERRRKAREEMITPEDRADYGNSFDVAADEAIRTANDYGVERIATRNQVGF